MNNIITLRGVRHRRGCGDSANSLFVVRKQCLTPRVKAIDIGVLTSWSFVIKCLSTLKAAWTVSAAFCDSTGTGNSAGISDETPTLRHDGGGDDHTPDWGTQVFSRVITHQQLARHIVDYPVTATALHTRRRLNNVTGTVVTNAY